MSITDLIVAYAPHAQVLVTGWLALTTYGLTRSIRALWREVRELREWRIAHEAQEEASPCPLPPFPPPTIPRPPRR